MLSVQMGSQTGAIIGTQLGNKIIPSKKTIQYIDKQIKFCNYCGMKNDIDNKYCKDCGKMFDN